MTRFAIKCILGAFAAALVGTSAIAQSNPNIQPLGNENPNKVMGISVMLKMRNEAQLKALVQQIHTKGSPNYRKFLTPAQFAAQFAPTAADSAAMQAFLKSQGLTVTYVDKLNLAVSARGTVANIEKAFKTKIGLFESNGERFNQPLVTPTISGNLSGSVKGIGGLTTLKVRSHAVRAMDVQTGKPLAAIPVAGHKNGLFFPADCFEQSAPINLTGTNLQAIYTGNGYPASSGCGYSVADMQHAYGLDSIIKSGLDGTGQTIVIVDAYGSFTLPQDVATFSQLNGLPAAKLNIIYNPTKATPDCVVGNGVTCGWEGETTLDVEWAHALAPNATIDLIVSPTANFNDLADIDLYIAENISTASVSHSFGFPEWLLVDYYGDSADYDYQAQVNYLADQVLGISNNYSSGDDGDFVTAGKSLVPDVSFPAGLANVTSVGGTSLALSANGNYLWENGWGTNASSLNYAPPKNLGFIYGAGGGTSLITPAPDWQYSFLGNAFRQQPDVAMDADPFTGAEIIITSSGKTGDPQFVESYGGTSLACPMFSAVWSLVAQQTGTNLGNAAPILYLENALFPGSLHDVVPVGSGHNAHGTIFKSGIPTAYSQWQLAGPYQNSPVFWESLWNAGNNKFYSLTFGTDSSLTTNVGWDNVTGVGTPNGAAFFAPFNIPD